MKGLSISTYEGKGKHPTLTLTHVFWGKTIEDAVGVAQSHMKTDRFFRSSLTGKFPWQGTTIHLVNKHTGQVEGLQQVRHTSQVERAIIKLQKEARAKASQRAGGGGTGNEYVANVFYII